MEKGPARFLKKKQLINKWRCCKHPTHIEGTQEEEGGLQAHREDEAQNGDDDQCSHAERLGHDDDDDERRKDSHPQQCRQVGVQHHCIGGDADANKETEKVLMSIQVAVGW